MPVNDAYRPNIEKWTCTRPFFVTSFSPCTEPHQSGSSRLNDAESRRSGDTEVQNRWEGADADAALKPVEGGGEDNEDENEAHNNNEEDEGDEDDWAFEVMTVEIDLISAFVRDLKHQVQFRDQPMLKTLQREGAAFFRLAKARMEKERIDKGSTSVNAGQVNKRST